MGKMSEPGKSGDASQHQKDNEQKKTELQKSGLWEIGMTGQEIDGTYQALCLSKQDMSISNSQNDTINMSPEPVRQTCYDKALSNILPLDRGASSSEVLSNKNSNITQQKQRESSDDDIFDDKPSSNSFHSNINDFPTIDSNIRGRSSENEKSSDGTNANKINEWPHRQKQNKIVMWKIDPFDCCVDEEYVPLPSRLSDTREDRKDNFTKSNIDKKIAQLSKRWRIAAEEYLSQRLMSDESRFQLGSPIKVAPEDRSSNKKSGTKEAHDNGESSSNTIDASFWVQTRRPRACTSRYKAAVIQTGSDGDSAEDFVGFQNKRKSAEPNDVSDDTNSWSNNEQKKKRRISTKKSDDYNYQTNDSSDEDYEKSAKSMKKKKTNKPRAKNPAASRKNKPKSNESSLEVQESQNNLIENGNEVTDAPMNVTEITISDDDANSQADCKNNEISQSKEKKEIYPRRIVPPSQKYSGIRMRTMIIDQSREINKTNSNKDDQEVTRTYQQRLNVYPALEEEGIREALEASDDEFHISPVRSDSVEFRPLPLTERMRKACQRLVGINEKKKNDETIREQQHKLQEKIIARETQERIRQRIKAEAAKARKEEQLAKAKEKEEETWREMLKGNKNSRFERTELNPDGPRKISETTTVEALVENNHYMTNLNELERMNSNSTNRSNDDPSEQISCPICGKKFSVNEISEHAGSCEEYCDTDTAGPSRSTSSPTMSSIQTRTSKLHTCEVCNRFTTPDGRIFEDHVTRCIANHRDGIVLLPNVIIPVPDSPIRSMRLLSQQSDSSINYKGNFEAKTKSHVAAKKRRRI